MPSEAGATLEGGARPAAVVAPALLRGEEEGASWAGWAERLSWPAELLGQLGQKLKKIPFGIKIRFLNLQRLWKFVQGDLGGILIWGFFLNSSRILKDFRKIQYAMPCNASCARLFLERFLYAR
jgi:hypothetical protein